MKSKFLLLVFLTAMSGKTGLSQGLINPALSPGPWPVYHANTSCTASVRVDGRWSLRSFETVPNLKDRRFRVITVSPWTVIAAPFPDGDQAVYTTPLEGVAKYALRDGRLVPVDLLPLQRNRGDFDWNIAILRDGSVLATEIRNNGFAVVGSRGGALDAPLQLLRRLTIPKEQGTITTHFNVAFDGTIIVATREESLLAVHPGSGRVLSRLDLRGYDYLVHNGFPIDSGGRIYLIAQNAMLAVDWNGSQLTKAWESRYNSRGPGFEGKNNRSRIRERLAVIRGQAGTGSGTTPTLIGNRETGIAVIVDGHSPNNRLVAFWRDRIPDGWQPLRDPVNPNVILDRRVAGVLPLPLSTPDGEGFSAENSPAALGNSVVVAQWAGFRPDATPPKGLQRVDWNPATRKLTLAWANPNIHFNGVPTIVAASNGRFTVGMGRSGDRYLYSVVNFETGQLVNQIDLGTSDAVLDQGNSHAVASDGSVIYAGKRELIRLTPGLR